MEEAGILEKITRSGFCYPALNQVDLIYHAINRGNNRADVLGPEGERDMFLGDLARTKARYPFASSATA